MKNVHLKKSGVTLIELIIVVVIIGVLSTLAVTKFTQGNYSEKARIARITDYALKVAASARHAKNSDNEIALHMDRANSGAWSASVAGHSPNAGEYMTSISSDIEMYTAHLTTGTGDTNQFFQFSFNEVIVFIDPEINDLNPSTSATEDRLVVDFYGEISFHTETSLEALYTVSSTAL